MVTKSTARRITVVFAFGLFVLGSILFRTGVVSTAGTETNELVGITSVTKSAALVAGNGDGDADPGDTIEYTVTIQNDGTQSTGVTLTDVITGPQTLIAGSDNILPNARDNSFNAIGNVQLVMPDDPASDLLANDTDFDGGTVTITGFGNTLPNANANLPNATITTTNGGSLTIRANGSFDYNPPRGLNTAETFFYTVSDGQGGTDTAQVNITINGMIWFVNPAAAAGGDGRFTNPYQLLSTFQTANGGAGGASPDNNDSIFLYSGAHTAPLTLRAGQILIGQGASAQILSIITPVIPAASGTSQLPTTTVGTNPVLTSGGIGITLANNVTIRGVTVGSTTGAKLSGSNFGTLTIGNTTTPDVTLSGAGQAMNLSVGAFAATSAFSSVTTTSSVAQGINLAGITGTVAFGSTTVSASTSQGILIGTTTANINFGNASVTGGTNGISMQNNSSGTRTFGTLQLVNQTGAGNPAFLHSVGGGTTTAGVTTITNPAGIGISVDASTTAITFGNTTVTGSGGAGVSFTNNTNAAGDLTFADLDISPDANVIALSTSGNTGGQITATSGTVATTGASALGITSTPLALAFDSITMSGGTTPGISLTTASGSLSAGNTSSLTGNGTAATFIVSGGTVAVTYSGNITQANNAAIVSVAGGHATGTITFQTGTLSGTNGTGLQFDNADGTYNFIGTTTLNGGDAGVDIQNGSTGTFNFGTNTTITNPTNDAFNLDGATASNATVTYSGSISKNNAGFAIDIDNHDANNITFQTGTINSTGTSNGIRVQNSGGGTIAFNNATKTLTTGANTAVTFATNTGATINFTGGGLVIRTATGGGINATGGGTITVQGAGNTIKTQDGTPLNVNATNIGLSGLTFQCISAGRNDTGGTNCDQGGATGTPANGIVLNSTGTTAGTHGGLTVTGTGTTDGSGGVIQNTTGRGASFITGRNMSLSNITFTNAGTTDLDATNGGLSTGDNLDTNAAIHLVSVTTATLDNVDITGGAEQGINGNAVSAFSLVNSTVTNVGNAADEDNIHFFNMSGTSAITGTTLTRTAGGGDDNMNLQTQSGTLNLTISGSSAVGTGGGVNQLGSGWLFGIRGTTNATITFNNTLGAVSSTNNFSGGLVADVFDTATMALNVSNFTSSGNNDQLSVSAGDNSNVDLSVTGSTLSAPAAGDFLPISLTGSALDNGFVFDARITGNTITVGNGLASDGIVVNNAGGGFMNVLINGNTFDYSGSQRGIVVQSGTDGAGAANVTITGNTMDIKLDGANNAVTGILAQASVASPTGDGASLCADIGGAGAASNTFTHSLGGAMAGGDIRVRQRLNGTARLPGYVGAAGDTAAVIAYLNGRNIEVSPATATADSTGFAGGAACTQPNPFAELTTEKEEGNLAFLGKDQPANYYANAAYDRPLASFVDIAALERQVAAKYVNAGVPNVEARASAEVAALSAAELLVEPVEATANDEFRMSNDEVKPESQIGNPKLEVDLLTHVGAFFGAIGEMISPTAHAQKTVERMPLAPEGVNDVNKGPFTLPAGEVAVIKFRTTVDNGPYASGVNTLTNTANVTANGGTININSNQTSINLDAAPDLQVTVSDGATTTQPGGVIQYATTYQNNTAVNGQDAAAVRISQTVPPNTTFNATVSGAGWSCADDSAAGTVCTFDVGTVNAGAAPAALNFAVNVLVALPAGAVQISDTATISEIPADFNGTDRVPANNTSTDTTNIIGNWDGSASTDWHDPNNWSNNVVPPDGNSVSIPGVVNQPVVSSQDVFVNNLFLNGENVTIAAGRMIDVVGDATLGTNIIDGDGTLALGVGSTLVRTTGQVNAALLKDFDSLGAFIYHVGTATGYSPVLVNITNLAVIPSSLTIKANDGTAPSTLPLNDATTLDRFWTLTEDGDLTADVTFNYLDADVDGNEVNYRTVRVTGLTPTFLPNGSPCPGAGSPCVDATANTIFVGGLTSFSDWTATELVPTAADVTVSGRVLNSNGRGVNRARVRMEGTDGSVRMSLTNAFGYYRFFDVGVGETYVLSVTHKRHTFAPRLVSVFDALDDVNFIAEP